MKVRVSAVAILLTTVLGLAGCGSGEPAADDVVGSLELQQAQSSVNEEFVQIGTLVVESPVPVYDVPDGVTVGRIGEGEYPVYDEVDGWFQVELVEEDSNSFGWVPPNNGKYEPKQ